MAEQLLERIMPCTGESFFSHKALLALWGFHLLAMIQTRIRKGLLRDHLSMLLRKAVLYSINLLIYDLNQGPIHSKRLEENTFTGFLNKLNNVLCW